MERLRQQDAREGISHQPRTDEQKGEIAEIQSRYAAKIAQAEVMHRSALAGILDEGARAQLEDEYQRERARLQAEREARVEQARRGN
jgi:hypothetical protein